jgi:hypothetical protein
MTLQEHELVKGAVYETTLGRPRVEYIGLDTYMGQTTHQFRWLDGRGPQYMFVKLGRLDTLLTLAAKPLGEPPASHPIDINTARKE